ncbi:sugar ABC transporter permease [Faecalicatena contorta]|uniref:carbohydrate ABC transporter permease n=1 Tax=Faecalicatena contorta TaxID=39482 RepID=UPI00129E43FD|nr:sugar ABC transporter permease [Faecalicatena contorta]MRM87271.1 sugar ABC transporter permease [Faecalicatena contorta]
MHKRKRLSWNHISPYLFVTPTVVVLLIFLIIPFIMVVGYSLFDNVIVNKNPAFVGISNFISLLKDSDFWNAVKNTLFFVVVSIIAHMLIGMFFAMTLNSEYLHNRTKGIFRVVYALPWMFTAAVVAIVWRIIMNPNGVMDYLITVFGLGSGTIEWLSSRDMALKSVTLINIWAGYPFFMMSLLAGLQGISTDLYEASALDGASSVKRFFYITIPQLKPILVSLLMLDFVWTLQQFAMIWMTTGGGPVNSSETIGIIIYKEAFVKFQYSNASAAAVILLAVCTIIGVFYVKHQRAEE